MFTAMEMIPYQNKYLERNIRQGGYLSQDAAERAVLRRGCGFVKHYETGEVVSVVMKGRIWFVKEK
jgi:hypothetical protein